jgi:hypothetical protein
MAIIIVLVFILAELTLGIFYLFKFPQKFIESKLDKVKKEYMLDNETLYLSSIGRYNIISSICLSIMFFILLHFNRQIDPIMGIIFIIVMWIIRKKQQFSLLQ